MPLYEYQCPACSSVSEIHHKMSAPNPTECPRCGGGPLSKLISRTNFSLKGGGWYNDGYGGKSNKSETKTDTTPAAKSDDKTPEKSGDKTEKPTEAPKTETPKAAPQSSHTCTGGGCH